MRKAVFIISWICMAFFYGCAGQPDISLNVHECAPMPQERACATCFVYDDKAYVFGGRDNNGICKNDLWRYDPVTDSWTDLGDTPLSPRLNATACVTTDAVYIGLGYVNVGSHSGYYQDSSYLRDWYRFQPESHSFTRLDPYPNYATDKAVSWAYSDDILYVGYGFRYTYSHDVFRYDVSTNHWDSIDTHVSYMGYPSRCFGATGVVCQGRMFAGTGYRRVSLRWWAELVPDSDNPLSAHWEHRADVPSPERTLAACAATDDAVYLAGGLHYGGLNTTGKMLQDMLCYYPNADRWERIATLPEPLCNHLMFRIGNNIYTGIGETWRNDSLVITPKLYRLHAE